MLTQWVVKVSKLCNLRCDYCYEMPELGNPARMSLDEIATLFDHMAGFYARDPLTTVHFIWHGGEPLVQDPSYYRAIFAEQKRRLDGIRVRNVVQTNLTILDDERMALLRDGFDGVGVSIDLFGEHRLNLAGRSSQHRVLTNLDRLHEAGIPFGCITVLTRRTLPHLEAIFRFYEQLGVSFRILPLFRGATDDQNDSFQVDGGEVLDALCRLFDLWLESPTRIAIAPFAELTSRSLRRRAGDEPTYYDRRAWEEVVIVNTNGDLYSDGEAYEPGKSWGNILAAPLGELVGAPAWERSVLQTERRMAAACVDCPHFGTCRGYAVGEDNRRYDDEIDGDGRMRCIVERGLCDHIERRLDQAAAAGLVADDLWRRLRAGPAIVA